jgi:hypothetical protein
MVDDVDAHYQHALAEGAVTKGPPVDQPYGYREYSALDLEGLWLFMKPLDDACRAPRSGRGVPGRGRSGPPLSPAGPRPLGQARVKSMTQLDSQVCPPSGENSCSHRAEVGVMSDQMKCALIGLPSCVSSP